MKKLLPIVILACLLQSCLVNQILRQRRWAKKSTPESKIYHDTISFKRVNGWIIIDAEVGGRMGEYILDSGAPTILDYYEVARKDVLTKPELDRKYDHVELPFDRLMKYPYDNLISNLKIHNTTFLKVGASTVKFSKFSKTTNCENFKGIIGVNVMNDGVWKINYETNKIFIADNISKFEVDETYRFKMKTFGGMKNPIIQIPIGNTVCNALLDLGNAGGIIVLPNKNLRKSAAAREEVMISRPATLMRTPLAPKGQEPYSTAIMHFKSNIFFDELRFLVIDNVDISDKEIKKIDIIIGNEFFKNFNVTFDWPNEMVYFEPIKEEFEKPLKTEVSNFNIGFFNYDKKVYVQSVFPRFCDTTLIHVADTVKAINNIPIEDIVGDNYCDFISGDKSLIPDTDEPIFITVKNKNGVVNFVELKKVTLFE